MFIRWIFGYSVTWHGYAMFESNKKLNANARTKLSTHIFGCLIGLKENTGFPRHSLICGGPSQKQHRPPHIHFLLFTFGVLHPPHALSLLQTHHVFPTHKLHLGGPLRYINSWRSIDLATHYHFFCDPLISGSPPGGVPLYPSLTATHALQRPSLVLYPSYKM